MPVTGVVLNAITGKPIEGAVVGTLRPEDRRYLTTPPRNLISPRPSPPHKIPGPKQQQMTDAEGRFRFESMDFKERQYFYVTKAAYLAPDSSGSSIPIFEVSVMPGMGELRFKLNPEAELNGKVISSDGLVMKSLMVSLYRVQYTAGRPHWIHIGQQRTDTSGSYHFGELPAGTYFVVSQWLFDNDPLPPDTNTCNDSPYMPDGGFAPESEPGVLDFHKAVPIILTEGGHAVADLRLQHQVFHPVTILHDPDLSPGFLEIVDRNGRNLELPVSPSVNCVRRLHPSGDRQQSTIHLPDGNYTFHQHAAYSLKDPFKTGGAKQPVFLGGYISVAVAGKPVSVMLPAVPEDDAAPVEIRVHHEKTTSSADGSTHDVCSPKRPGGVLFVSPGTKLPPPFQIEMLSADNFGGQGVTVHVTEKNTDLYEAVGSQPGRFWLITQVLDLGYVSKISAAGLDLLQHPLVIGMDRTSVALDITVRDDCGRIHFEKPWTKPAPGAVLADAVGIVNPFFELLVPQFFGATPHGQFSQERSMMELGRPASITVGNLPPGHYKLFEAFDESAVSNFSPVELDKRLGPAKHIWLKPREQVNLNILDLPK
ncbi:hypothetical protein [Granulicella tundricola]|uniref:Uncharacterized protein n=1 Tax=Granulicella tundricola (strain ATCC BAA-1859 / DSM 23138 / MP5ACTX9) TaxID=1198114 RepID=E8X7V8_GRATM|nr:hypothetical protein [Granulicella tundricola]ADW71542.1 hypothetical protein AciX9_4612 [Granulicella tundricola MP5ACTX9]